MNQHNAQRRGLRAIASAVQSTIPFLNFWGFGTSHRSRKSPPVHQLSKAVAQALEPRTLLASVAEYVFNDLDVDGVKGASEPGIPSIGVDLYTGSGDHFSTTTDADGHYNFSGVDPGICDYVVLGPHPGWSSTTASGAGIYFSGDSDAEGPNFGLSTSTTASGVVSFDRDGTGTFSPGDGGAGNVTLFGDTNHNGVLDSGEPVAVSNPDGSFQIGNLLSSGGGSDVAIRAIGPAGWQFVGWAYSPTSSRPAWASTPTLPTE